MDMTFYRTLGRSGLGVSPLALGTMTFGTARWGADDAASEAIFNAYTDAGGNFIDTANVYAGGRSEELVGQFVAKRGLRNQVVLATKFGFNVERGNVHGGGNGRKHIHQALEASLRRLNTDYIDLYWLHAYDRVTPVEEVLHTCADLVRAGKIRYFGFSDMPAWYAAKGAALAQAHHMPGPIALQLAYSLIERNIEHEFVPVARDAGLGITPWSPLGAGFLTGKYSAESAAHRPKGATMPQGRLALDLPAFQHFTPRNWAILGVLREVAAAVGHTPAQVALAWVMAQEGITSPIVGATTVAQLQESMGAAALVLEASHLHALTEASAPPMPNPYGIFTDVVHRGIFGGHAVQGWQG